MDVRQFDTSINEKSVLLRLVTLNNRRSTRIWVSKSTRNIDRSSKYLYDERISFRFLDTY